MDDVWTPRQLFVCGVLGTRFTRNSTAVVECLVLSYGGQLLSMSLIMIRSKISLLSDSDSAGTKMTTDAKRPRRRPATSFTTGARYRVSEYNMQAILWSGHDLRFRFTVRQRQATPSTRPGKTTTITG